MDETIKTRIQEELRACDGVKSATWDISQPFTLNLKIDVHLPQDYEEQGVSRSGVKAIEEVRLEFGKDYPFVAPNIVLRDDFPRSFPHINPSREKVVPCVYEGDLTELIQHSGLELLVYQLATWLRKAAADDLMDLNQGWECVRNDDCSGVLKGDFHALRAQIFSTPFQRTYIAHMVESCFKNYFAAIMLLKNYDYKTTNTTNNVFPCVVCAASFEKVISVYYPNQVTDLNGLQNFFEIHIGKNTLNNSIKKIEEEKNLKRFIVVAVVRRPVHLINSDTHLEILPFLVNIKRTKKGKIASRSSVLLLGAADLCSSPLMRNVSGHTPAFSGRFVQIGCGSLGSKISMHLIRNGLEDICFVDRDMFLAHNMARHALVCGRHIIMKHMAMKAVADTFNIKSEFKNHYIEVATKLSATDLIVDSSASRAVRNRLALDDVKARIIHTALYGKKQNQCGICFVEGANRNPRVDDICFRFMCANVLGDCDAVDYSTNNLEYYIFGQGCSTLTMKIDDSTISLLAAGMAHRIQGYLDSCLPEMGACYFGRTKDGESVQWEHLNMGKTIVLPGVRSDGYHVRILSIAQDEMNNMAKMAKDNETGGYLIGAVTANTKTITVVACLPPPIDSCGTPIRFVLGSKGMNAKKDIIEQKSNGVLAILGTWHTHPRGGCPSPMDRATYEKIFKHRSFPTLCIVWTPEGIECLPEMKEVGG